MSHNLHETVRKSSEMWKMSEDRALILEKLCYNMNILWISAICMHSRRWNLTDLKVVG